MHIDWGQLGLVLIIGLIAGAGVVIVFALGVALLLRSRQSGQPPDEPPSQPPTGFAGRRRTSMSLAILCFGACLAAVVFGIYLLVPAFH